MVYKKCYSCKQEKELSEFSIDKGSKDNLQGTCRVCMKEYRRKHYIEKRDDYLERTRKALKKRHEERELYKSSRSCKNCGEKRWWVLEFHHRDPKQKEFNIGHLSTRSMHKMQKEMEKCDILCANCHRDFHHQERMNKLGSK